MLLKIGSQGEALWPRQVQGGLNHAGASIYPELETDGIFGSGKTHARVVESTRARTVPPLAPRTASSDTKTSKDALDKFIEAVLLAAQPHQDTDTAPPDVVMSRPRATASST